MIQACCAFQRIGGTSAEREGGEEQIEAGPLEFPAQPRDQRQDKHDGDELESVRVFAKKPEPDRADRSAGQNQEKFGLRSRASQKVNMAAIQKKIESGSIVMSDDCRR